MPTPPVADIVLRLAQHTRLGGAPASEHEWLATHGSMRSLAAGAELKPRDGQARDLYIILSGSLSIRADSGAGARKIVQWGAGEVSGTLPFSRGTGAPSAAIAEAPTEYLDVPRAHFPEMIRECPHVVSALVHAMIDRSRVFTAHDNQNEKLVSLGKLAAGLAHELNNPASAAVRSAKMLTESLAEAESAARRLGAARLSDAQLAAIDALRTSCAAAGSVLGLSTVARADREDAITDWLADHGADEGCAGPLADTSISLADLDALAVAVSGDALDATLRWISSGCLVRSLAGEIETASSRVYDLVAAIKGFTYMDRAPTPEPVDVRQGITDTFTMLGAKIRAKSVELAAEFPDDLPCAQAVGVELNQVWMNLIDNALDAVTDGGRVTVRAAQEQGRVVVHVIDDGPGIPAEIQRQVFDPFFTTKGVGKGTGLGLDIVRRLLVRFDGEIELDSRPGHTRFCVRLPMAT